ncbi:DUF746 domain-containing protein [Burkholderia ubonensis]|uniref:DUF746 domain-containing protein n=1 Tax=Burkholderia ubonensis TaxID=101571 RepID=UPI00210B97CA|nr:DUF746 domain-containing protein [Burkholderia ubonensis]
MLPGTRRTNHETTPTRHFDATVGAITAKEPVDDVETEDVDLTDYLMRAWYHLIHHSPTPVPRCPHCDGLRIRPDRPSGKSKLPIYFCHTCKKSFNRLTGTPFARLQNLAKGTEMIPLLSRQMSLLQAGERLGRTQKAVLSWLLAFRRYLLELDPTGRWEARVRLGMRVAPRVVQNVASRVVSCQADSILSVDDVSVARSAGVVGSWMYCRTMERASRAKSCMMRLIRQCERAARSIQRRRCQMWCVWRASPT